MPRRPGRTAAAPAAHLTRTPRWNGVAEGDAVDIATSWGRRGHWRFVAHVTNERNGAQWVEVVGGRSGQIQVRSCPVEAVLPSGGHRDGSPPLAHSPRLPLQ